MSVPASPTLDINGQPYNSDLSPFYPTDKRPTIPSDCFTLPENAKLNNKTDYFAYVNHEIARISLDGWTPRSFQKECDTGKAHGFTPWVYYRPIKSDPTLYAAMQEYASRPKDLTTALKQAQEAAQAAADKVKKLEEEVKKAEEIRVGDWVTSDGWTIFRGVLYQVSKVDGDDIFLCYNSESLSGYTSNKAKAKNSGNLVRKATPAEIAAHEAKQAETKRLKEEEEKKIKITVDEVEYTAFFQTGKVAFGWNIISNRQIRAAQQLLQSCGHVHDFCNCTINSVTIGKGVFGRAILDKLVSKLID